MAQAHRTGTRHKAKAVPIKPSTSPASSTSHAAGRRVSRRRHAQALSAGALGRVVILNITPTVAEGRYPPRVELGEAFTVTAQLVLEGRRQPGARVVLRNPRGRILLASAMVCVNPGLDLWKATLRAGEHSDALPWQEKFAAVRRQLGLWSVSVEAWNDPYALWLHDARIKIPIGDDVDNTLIEGAEFLERWAASADSHLPAHERRSLRDAARTARNGDIEPQTRLQAMSTTAIADLHATRPLREQTCSSPARSVLVQRPKSSFAAWYQFFPRSEGAYVDPSTGRIVQGTLSTAASGLERARREGFDIVYVPPVSPIGETNRKGRNNALTAGPDDPGSPFGVGSPAGGHDAVDPRLGTMADFRAFTARAHELGLEVALDFALQCSPDHPWVHEHPEWFRHKPDGSIAFAENPPKQYQDIYPVDFDEDMPGIVRESVRILTLWIDAGVTIFRVDNPHTKPVHFWRDVIAAVTRAHPEVLFLAEAFTRPAMMRALSYVGFTQSHCYFPWRNTEEELSEYLPTTNGDEGYYQHNTFWPTTPDILTAYIRDNSVAGHAVRAVLAAMGSPSWGIYSGYELIENRQRPGFEEQINNEKYEVRIRDWSRAKGYGIAELLTALNRIRRAHPACLSYHNLTMLQTGDPNILAFARHTPSELTGTGRADTLIVAVNLDCLHDHGSDVHFDPTDFDLPATGGFPVHDELTGRVFTWSGDDYVSLAPWADVAHILAVGR